MIRALCCPANADEFSDEYVLGRIPADAAAEFEAHAMACTDCASLIENSRTIVQLVRLAGADPVGQNETDQRGCIRRRHWKHAPAPAAARFRGQEKQRRDARPEARDLPAA